MKIDNKGNLVIDIQELIEKMTDEQKEYLLEVFTMDQILPAIERQLKHETYSDWWNTCGARDGDKIREWVMNIKGLEPEFRKDMESKLRSAEHDRDHYRKYYDFYYRIMHHKNTNNEYSLWDYVKKCVGEI